MATLQLLSVLPIVAIWRAFLAIIILAPIKCIENVILFNVSFFDKKIINNESTYFYIKIHVDLAMKLFVLSFIH